MEQNDLTSRILNWYEQYGRKLPWRTTTNPYFIWLSEIILQQTRIEQGLNYYLKFIKKYPSINDLAKASEREILNEWQGLGYYSRARNLHHTSKTIINQYQGKFPEKFEDILKLKGIGTYTASAIASFAFKQPKAVVDGNVYRFLSRVFDIKTPINSSEGVKLFQKKANTLICNKNPDKYNHAIMDIGSTICTPKHPKCIECPANDFCLALKNDTIKDRPVKLKKLKTRKRFFLFYVISENNEIILEKRTQKDIWQNMYQFPLIELNEKQFIEQVQNNQSLKIQEQKLTHQKIICIFRHAKEVPGNIKSENIVKINIKDIKNYPVPKIIDNYLQKLY